VALDIPQRFANIDIAIVGFYTLKLTSELRNIHVYVAPFLLALKPRKGHELIPTNVGRALA